MIKGFGTESTSAVTMLTDALDCMAGVGVIDVVVSRAADTLDPKNPGQFHMAEVLTHSVLRQLKLLGELAHAVALLHQKLDDPQPGRVGQDTKNPGRVLQNGGVQPVRCL